MAVIDEPAAAVAAARCLSARTLARRPGDEWRPTHPRRCAWCAYEPATLSGMLDGWNAWSGAKERGRATVYERYSAQAFSELQRRDPAEAERQIVEAQGLEAEPMEAQAPGPAHDSEDVTAWLS